MLDRRKGLKLAAIASDMKNSVAEVLGKPVSELADRADQRTLALWAADCAERVLPRFEERHPEDHRPRRAIEALRTWAATGVFRMADVRKASLAAHAAASEAEGDDAVAAARAAGQAIATAHVPTHAIGAAAYAIKAAALHSDDPDDAIIKERDWQLQRLRRIANAPRG